MLNSEEATFHLDPKQSVSLSAKESLKHPPSNSNSLQRMLTRVGKKARLRQKTKTSWVIKMDPPGQQKASSQHFEKCIIHLPHPSSPLIRGNKGSRSLPGQSLATSITHGSTWCWNNRGKRKHFCVNTGLGSKEKPKSEVPAVVREELKAKRGSTTRSTHS